MKPPWPCGANPKAALFDTTRIPYSAASDTAYHTMRHLQAALPRMSIATAEAAYAKGRSHHDQTRIWRSNMASSMLCGGENMVTDDTHVKKRVNSGLGLRVEYSRNCGAPQSLAVKRGSERC